MSVLLPNVFAGGGPAAGITVQFAAAGFGTGGVSLLTDTFEFQL